MILKRAQYNQLQADIKAAGLKRVSTSTESRSTATPYIYIAKVTLSTNTATGSTATVWVYQAKILWTPFGKTDLDEWEISDTAKSGDTDLLLSKYDLEAHGTDIIYLPCVQRGTYFENIATGAGGGGTSTTDDVSINLNTDEELQIYGWETALPAATKSLAEILMGV
jgi:hypothetical protein